MDLASIDPVENKRRMLSGEMYYSFTPDLVRDRTKCKVAMARFNAAVGLQPRRQMVQLMRK